MVSINWNNFKSNFADNPQLAFELLAYLLFCDEYNNGFGIFGYKNHPGIETKPVLYEGGYFGFQAKFFENKFDKSQVIESIDKAKIHEPQLTDIVIYTNINFSPSYPKDKSYEKPTYQADIEEYTKKIELNIHWQPSNIFELQLNKERNFYIKDIFFQIAPSSSDISQLTNILEIDDLSKVFERKVMRCFPEGIKPSSFFWNNLIHKTKPELNNNIFIIDRFHESKRLLDIINGEPSTLSIYGDSTEDSIGFVISSIQNEKDNTIQNLKRNTPVIIFDDEKKLEESYKYLSIPSILICKKPVQSTAATRDGHHILWPSFCDNHEAQNHIDLPRASSSAFAETLCTLNIEKSQADRLALETNRSIPVLIRRIPSAAQISPYWGDDHTLIPLMLINRWNEDNENDKYIISKLCNANSYKEATAFLNKHFDTEDSPIIKIGSAYSFISHFDSFEVLGRRLTEEHLCQFQEVAIDVLTKIDPIIDIPAEDRWMTPLPSPQEHSSGLLRGGIAQTILLLRKCAENHAHPNSELASACLNSVWGNLNYCNDWKLLASLRDVYPCLMEAYPGPFLAALKELTHTSPDFFQNLCKDGGPMGGNSLHHGILWGLERAAWLPDYAFEAVTILMELAAIPINNTRSGNSPLRSLYEIFLPWHPHIGLTSRERIELLNKLASQSPDTTWKLVKELMPEPHALSTGTDKPQLRDYALPPTDEISLQEEYEEIGNIALRLAKGFPKRIAQLLGHVQYINSHNYESLFLNTATETIDSAAIKNDLESITELWSRAGMLHAFTLEKGNHMAIHQDIANKCEQLIKRDNDYWIKIITGQIPCSSEALTGTLDYRKSEQILKEIRIKSLSEYYNINKDESIVTLLSSCIKNYEITQILVQDIITAQEIINLIKLASNDNINVSRSIFQLAFYKNELFFKTFIESDIPILIQKEKLSNIISSVSSNKIWNNDFIKTNGLENTYWKNVRIYFRDVADDEFSYVVSKLLEADRSDFLISEIYSIGKKLSPDELIRIGEAFKEKVQRDKAYPNESVTSNYTQQYFDHLHKASSSVSKERIAKLEYFFLPVFGFHPGRHDLILNDWLEESSAFFIELLCYAFKRASDDAIQSLDPKSKSNAEHSYRLLHSWRPKFHEHPESEKKLLAWIDETRKLAKECDRIAVCDLLIGEALASMPVSEDGIWPHAIARQAIEHVDSSNLTTGIVIGKLNSRGAISKSLNEGGEQERALADQFKRWKDQLSRIEFKRTRMILQELADDYLRQAERDDTRRDQRSFFER